MSVKFKIGMVVAFLLLTSPVFSADFGRYIGDVIAKWLDDGRTMELQQDFVYVDSSGVEWLAPKGAKVDGASIPPAAWPLIGGPFEGRYRNASVIHDVACQLKSRPWQAVHRVFYDAMLLSGVSSLKARTMYAAVLIGGPKWSREIKLRNVPYQQAQGRASVLASTKVMSGEIANTKIVLGPTVPQSYKDSEKTGPNLPPTLANIEVVFAPQPSVVLTADQVKSLEQEIESENLSVEQIENRYLLKVSR